MGRAEDAIADLSNFTRLEQTGIEETPCWASRRSAL